MVRQKLMIGDSEEVMGRLPANTFTAVITDPPYGLKFMGKEWDHGVPGTPYWTRALRVAKPGAFLLAFGGTRTYHRLTCAIEDAGWELRDTVMWLYGQGFPKSHDVSKAIDKAAGAAKRWEGYGTALKPAFEPICVAMKPLEGTFAANALKHGVAGLNIGGCRIPVLGSPIEGRWPANIIHDGSEEVLAGLPNVKAGVAVRHRSGGKTFGGDSRKPPMDDMSYSDSGSAARFFYCAKASKKERTADGTVDNSHPTVKPIALMKYLLKLVTYPEQLMVFAERNYILDPFCGSGSTLVACKKLGIKVLGIDNDRESIRIALGRLRST